ncbi:unnamed protein product [Arabidopsis lyrata]|nr:unnamed protein product [Arabidopsis lyrata]
MWSCVVCGDTLRYCWYIPFFSTEFIFIFAFALCPSLDVIPNQPLSTRRPTNHPPPEHRNRAENKAEQRETQREKERTKQRANCVRFAMVWRFVNGVIDSGD